MKKILSLVLVAAMMLSLVVFAPAASAANIYTVEVTDATASAGSTVTLDVVVTGSTIFGFGLAIEYDATRLANPVVTPNTKLFGAGTLYNEADYQVGFTTNANDTTNGVDASEGVVVLTVEFKVLADAPAGEAYVRVAPFKNDSKIYICETDVKATGARYDWDVIEGTVTILPKGCVAGAVPAEIPASDLEYDVNKGEVEITGYLGKGSGTAIIPAMIEGCPVVSIGATAFNYAKFDTYVFPESVVSFGRRAVRQDAAFSAYVMAEDAKFDEKYYQSFVSNDGDVAVYSSASSTAKQYVADVLDDDDTVAISWAEGSYVAPPVLTIVAGEKTVEYVVSGDTVTLPESYAAAGKTVVGWNVNGSVVAPGANVAIDGNATVEAVTVGFATENGAAIKAVTKADDLALRFTVALNKADYAALEAIYGAENVSHGMLIAPQQYIKRAGGFSHAAFAAAGLKSLDYTMTGCYMESGDNYILAASIKNFSDVTRAKNPKFAAIGYIAITIGEETTYVYSDYTQSTARDAKFVLQNSSFTGDQAKWVSNLLTLFS